MQADQVVLGIQLVVELVAAAIAHPGQQFAGARPERHGCEERQRGIFAGVVAGGAPHGVDGARLDGVEALERRHQRARLIELDGQVARGHVLDDVLVARRNLADDREFRPEGALHFPAHFLRFGIARRAECRGADESGCGYCKEFLEQLCTSLVPVS